MTDSESKKNSRYIFLFLRVAVVAAGVIWVAVWVARQQRWRSLAEMFLQINPWVFAAALAIFVGCQGLVALRWWLLMRNQSVFIRFTATVRLHFLGLFYNNFLPSAVGGDLLRAWYVTKHTDRRFEAALSVFVDRIIGLLGTLMIAVFFYSLFLRGEGGISLVGGSAGRSSGFLGGGGRAALWCLGLFAAAIGVLLLHHGGRAWLLRAWGNCRSLGLRLFGRLRDATVIYCSKPLVILAAFALTFLLQIITITGFWLLGLDIGIAADLKYYFVFFTLTWVLGTLPVSIGGAVVVEGLLAYFFIHFAHVQAEAALALALCQRVVWMVASLPGAVIHLLGAHLPKDLWEGSSLDPSNT